MARNTKKTSSVADIETFGEKNGRLFLAQAKKFADFPDLLHLQKQ